MDSENLKALDERYLASVQKIRFCPMTVASASGNRIVDVDGRSYPRLQGWTDKREHLVLDALRMALTTRRRINSEFTSDGIIHHSDAGSQYTAIAFSEELEKEEMLGSIGTVGDALDNALMESTIGLYKTELIGERAAGRNWSGMREVERETAAWVQWYNTERLHSSIDYSTPIEREMRHAKLTPSPSWPRPANHSLSRSQYGSHTGVRSLAR